MGWLWNCCFPQQQNGAELLLWEASTQSTASAEFWAKQEERTSGFCCSQVNPFLNAVSFCVLPNVAVLQLLSKLHNLPACWTGSAHGVQTLSKGEKTCNLIVEEKLLWVAKRVHLNRQKLLYYKKWVFKDLTRQSLKWSKNPSGRKRVLFFFLVTNCGTEWFFQYFHISGSRQLAVTPPGDLLGEQVLQLNWLGSDGMPTAAVVTPFL